MRATLVTVLVAAVALTACSRKKDEDIVLTRLKDNGPGPNEFSIVPGKPLQPPEDFSSLPTPTPGGSNITDQTPLQDGIAALGGNPNAVTSSAPSASDGALINHSRRFGSQGNIREVLAAEDVDIRRRRGRVNILNLGQNDDYTLAYKRQWLDSQEEEKRLRNLGIQTPSAPPVLPGRRRR
ncbi:MAG: DUF3035 domain-containing protein [Pseudomonadota bacterium]